MTHSDADSSGYFDPPSRARRAVLATKREELLTPVQAIIDIADRILVDARHKEPPRFVQDLRRIRQAARELKVIIHDVLEPGRLNAASEADFQAMRSRIRHDMLNKLNPVINYSDMWLEDADALSSPAALPDLQLLHSLGKRCFALIDTILASWNMEAAVASSELPDLQIIQAMVERIAGGPIVSSPEVGRILVVDDNDINRDILLRLLESQGHAADGAANGREALEMLARGGYDLVLLDIVMPEMDGFTVLEKLKSQEQFRDLAVIMISALNEIEYVVNCIKMGAEDYLSRPYNPVFLKARIGACLEKKRLREREQQHLIEIDRQRLRADELLHVILPRQIVSELKATNTVLPRRYEGVAVLFADIVDFTPYCERHTAEEVVSHLQQLIGMWEDAALKYDVQKIKTIGDAFMAACGLLTPVENPVLNCIRFGQEMIAATHSLSSGWNLRIGIHCGHVMAGVLGTRQYLFDLFGDTVNTAARMESHGIKGAITLSEDAWRRVSNICEGTLLEPIPIKGKGEMVRHRFDAFR